MLTFQEFLKLKETEMGLFSQNTTGDTQKNKKDPNLEFNGSSGFTGSENGTGSGVTGSGASTGPGLGSKTPMRMKKKMEKK